MNMLPTLARSYLAALETLERASEADRPKAEHAEWLVRQALTRDPHALASLIDAHEVRRTRLHALAVAATRTDSTASAVQAARDELVRECLTLERLEER